jgi:hypothetical protein
MQSIDCRAPPTKSGPHRTLTSKIYIILHPITRHMAPQIIIIIVALALQLICYILIDKYNLPRWLKPCILLAALVFHVYWLPHTMITNLYANHPDLDCGLPATGILFFSWIFGAFPTLLEFGIYELRRRHKRLYKFRTSR